MSLCACFPGTCRGGQVVDGKLPNGDRCKACMPAEREHILSEKCWCHPTLDFVDPATGNKVFTHHNPN